MGDPEETLLLYFVVSKASRTIFDFLRRGNLAKKIGTKKMKLDIILVFFVRHQNFCLCRKWDLLHSFVQKRKKKVPWNTEYFIRDFLCCWIRSSERIFGIQKEGALSRRNSKCTIQNIIGVNQRGQFLQLKAPWAYLHKNRTSKMSSGIWKFWAAVS